MPLSAAPTPDALRLHDPAVVRVRRLDANALGRDFVCGDLHGNLALLERALAAWDFDPSRDRLLCAGDLVDRGRDSAACLRLAIEPWAFSVLGNHELMFLEAAAELFDGPTSRGWMAWDGRWASELPVDELLELASVAATLPHILSVGDGPGRFHVVHAEILPDDCSDDPAWSEDGFLHDDDLDWLDGKFAPKFADRLLWGRSIHQSLWSGNRSKVESRQGPGLSRTFCGHSGIAVPSVGARQAFLDCASWITEGGVCLAEAASGSFVVARNDGSLQRGVLDWSDPGQALRHCR